MWSCAELAVNCGSPTFPRPCSRYEPAQLGAEGQRMEAQTLEALLGLAAHGVVCCLSEKWLLAILGDELAEAKSVQRFEDIGRPSGRIHLGD